MASATSAAAPAAGDPWRPGSHFTPARHWLNDPNGLVFFQGTYHLFFQYHPHGLDWGPMHWGHASSTDLLHWQPHAIALRPDALGMIFSGSVVIDAHNCSGLGHAGQAPWVALYTQHDAVAEQAGSQRFQRQSLAFSLDQGASWTPYAGNPVLPNPGRKDFRDPKVFWHAASARWLMCLAAGDCIAFYSSPDLRQWTWESEFGAQAGAHGGVWECPDLLALPLHGRQRWVLIVSLMPGGPNGGSATQYFVGDFDGHHFVPEHRDIRWLDWGPDHYAGVSWHNTGSRCLLIGWMSNWLYARDLPTQPWRGAMTLPRELRLQAQDGQAWLAQQLPAEVLQQLQAGPPRQAAWAAATLCLDDWIAGSDGRWLLRLTAPLLHGFTLRLANAAGDVLALGFDRPSNAWWIDRRQAGRSDFSPHFAGRYQAPRQVDGGGASILLVLDRCALELFADAGLCVMSCLVFPRQPYCRLTLETPDWARAAPPGLLQCWPALSGP